MHTTAGHRASRKGRWSETGHAYLVTFTTHGRRPLFGDFHLAQIACHAIASSLSADHGTLVCWVLMPDHFHAVLRLAGHASLSRCVQRMKGRSSMACGRTTTQPGHIWSSAFHDHAVRADEDLAAVARYVIGNPVRAGLVDDVFDDPWWDAEWL